MTCRRFHRLRAFPKLCTDKLPRRNADLEKTEGVRQNAAPARDASLMTAAASSDQEKIPIVFLKCNTNKILTEEKAAAGGEVNIYPPDLHKDIIQCIDLQDK